MTGSERSRRSTGEGASVHRHLLYACPETCSRR